MTTLYEEKLEKLESLFENFEVQVRPQYEAPYVVDKESFRAQLRTAFQEIAAEAEKRERAKYRGHLMFIYRWISRLNGDKPHDRPEENWKSYVAAIVNYPDAPWQTGDWFEDYPLTQEK